MYIIKRLTHPNRSDDEEEIDGNVTSSQPSRHSRGQEGKGSRRRDEIETPSSQDEDEDPSSPPRRRVRRISKRTVVTSDEDEEDDDVDLTDACDDGLRRFSREPEELDELEPFEARLPVESCLTSPVLLCTAYLLG